MSRIKITEKQTVESLSMDAEFFIAQNENGVKSLRRAAMDLVEEKIVTETMSRIEPGGVVINVPGTDVTINGQENRRYICGELTSLSINPPATGIIDVMFTSGSTATTVTLPANVLMPTGYQIRANKIYEINILDGIYGAVMEWDT